MSADRLRRVAADMRAKAEAATPGPWRDMPMGSEGSVVVNYGTTIRTARKPATCREFADAAHIAAWSPPVALAVADWLEDEAKTAQRQLNAWPVSPHALALCDAWEGQR